MSDPTGARSELVERLRDVAFREEPSADATDDDWTALQLDLPITLEEMREIVALLREAADALASPPAVPQEPEAQASRAEQLMAGVKSAERVTRALNAAFGVGEAQASDWSPHTGDDDLLDALTGARTALESIAEDPDVDRDEAIQDALEELTKADGLRVEELKRAEAQASRAAAPHFTMEVTERAEMPPPEHQSEGTANTGRAEWISGTGAQEPTTPKGWPFDRPNGCICEHHHGDNPVCQWVSS